MPSLAELIQPQSASQIIATQVQLLQLAGLPATSWQSGSVPLSLIQADGQTLASESALVATIAQGGILTLAPALAPPGGLSPWVDLWADSQYGLRRKQGVATIGTGLLTDVGGGGPYVITPGQLIASNALRGGLLYTNTTGGTVPKNGSLPCSWQASAIGASFNIANGTLNFLITPLPGLAISNPDPGTGTWVTTLGTDPEIDASVIQRCQARWPGLGGGANVAVYEAWAIAAAATVTRALPLENTPTGGQVTIYLAGSSAGSPPADVAAVNAYIQTRRPLCVTVNVLGATNNPIVLSGTVTVAASQSSTAQTAFSASLTNYATSLHIGDPVIFAQLVRMLMDIPGVQNVAFTTPTADIFQASNQVATFTNALIWTPV